MFKSSLIALLPLCFCTTSIAQETTIQPNILFLFCDDLGYGDVGVFHQNNRKADEPRLHTPHIDQLAKEGIQLHAHYVAAPVCAPSRASLFLGQHQGNAPIRDNQFDKELPNQPTLASTLQQAGYHTALIGKWGLQGEPPRDGDTKATGTSLNWPSYPTKRGFDYYFGSVAHKDGHEHYPYDLVHFRKKGWDLSKTVPLWEQDKEISKGLKGCYSTDLFTAASKKFLIDHQKNSSEKPFFLFLSYDTPHAATQIATMPYPKGFGINGGLQWIGKPGQMINTASENIDSYIHPDYTDKSWQDVYKRYASSIRRIDNSVADITQTLKDLKLHENTLIVFSSDHGPSKESYIKEELKANFFQSFGPFSGIKRDCWEGGIRPGAIAAWPGKIKPGSSSQSPSQMHDWMATFCEVANTSTPAISDGVSLVPLLTGLENPPESKIYVEYSQNGHTPNYKQFPRTIAGKKRNQMQAVRVGNYKAIRYNVTSAKDTFMVFDLSKDPAETTNIAGKEGIPNQQFWLNTVSRLHHSNRSAKRPYDKLAIAPIRAKNVKPGLQTIEAKTNASTNYLSRDSFQLKGYLKIDRLGYYQFSFAKGVKGILRVHDIHTLDTDSKQSYPNNNTLRLKSGLHPFTIYLESEAEASDVLLWKTAEIKEATAVSADRFFH